MEYTRFDELLANKHIDLDDGIVTLKSGHTQKDKELFDDFVKTVNSHGYGIKSIVERKIENG